MAASMYKDAYFPLYIGVIQEKEKSHGFLRKPEGLFCIGGTASDDDAFL